MKPRIQTTVVGSYPIPDWLPALPSEQALLDATRVVFAIQESAGLDLVVDGELYRFDVNHPDTNGMIDYFVKPLAGVRSEIGRADSHVFVQQKGMGFRAKPAGVVEGAIAEGTLDIVGDYRRARGLTKARLKFTLTGPHMLSKTLFDYHYKDQAALCRALAGVLAQQVAEIEADVVQIDEANIPGHPNEAEWAAEAINIVLDAIKGEKAVHLCFGNYGGQTIQKGAWDKLIGFMNMLRADHLVLETARRSIEEVAYLKEVKPGIGIGLGVVDIKSTIVESAEEIARRIEEAEKTIGEGRVQYIHPDCGFWMLKRSIADRKMEALVKGRDLYLGL
ncbi:MAG TPA: cobalamin-independent methionine synthase II family protein [Abditibacteriaceae bacterium]